MAEDGRHDGMPTAPLPARVRPMESGPVELRIYNGQSRWLLQPTAAVEVWSGPRLLGTISGHALTLIVHHHLATAHLAAAVQAELERTEEAPALPRRPPVAIVPAEQRAALRVKRRARGGHA